MYGYFSANKQKREPKSSFLELNTTPQTQEAMFVLVFDIAMCHLY